MKDHERAAQVWAVLAQAATNRQTLTYERLSQLIGVPSRGLGNFLGHIQSYCMKKDLPALTSIVVHKDTGLPGYGFAAADNVPKAQADVYKYDWLACTVPTPSDLESAV